MIFISQLFKAMGPDWNRLGPSNPFYLKKDKAMREKLSSNPNVPPADI